MSFDVKEVKSQFDSEAGVTLIELLIVILIIAVLAGFTVMNFGTPDKGFQRQTGSRQLKEAFERARFDSVKRRADGIEPYAQVEVRTDRFILTTYQKEANGTANAKTSTTYLPSGIVLNHYSTGTLPMTITFNRRGETAGGTPQFRVCISTCSNPTSASADVILVTPTGTVNILPGDLSIPTFSDPTLSSTVAEGDGINNKVVMP